MKKNISGQHCQRAVVGRGWYPICLILQAQKKKGKERKVSFEIAKPFFFFFKEGDINVYFLFSAVIFQLFPIAELRYQFVTQALWAE